MSNWLNLEKEGIKRLWDPENHLIEFQFDISPDRQVYHRSIYTVLDWLGDIGGLYDALHIIGALLMLSHSIIRGDQLEAFLLRSVFKREVKKNLNKDLDEKTA